MIKGGLDRVNMVYVDNGGVTIGNQGVINWTDQIIDELKRDWLGRAFKTGRRFNVGKANHIVPIKKGWRGGHFYYCWVDILQMSTFDLETKSSVDPLIGVKLNNLTLKAFWEARNAVRRDWLLIGFAVMAGGFIPTLLKFVAGLFGKVVPL